MAGNIDNTRDKTPSTVIGATLDTNAITVADNRIARIVVCALSPGIVQHYSGKVRKSYYAQYT